MANINYFDPHSDMTLLKRAKNSVAIDYFLNPGPWWYAPATATLMGGVTIWGHNVSRPGNLLAAAAGLLAAAAVIVHHFRTRVVKPKPSATGALLTLLTVFPTLAILGLWGSAASAAGIENFAPWYAGAMWIATTAFLLAVGAIFRSIRRRRGPVA